jgi:protein-disulfide isomerase
MNSKKVIVFGVILIILLAGIFFLSALDYLNDFRQPVNQQQIASNGEVEDGLSFRISETDPLITPASKLYQSLIRETDPVRGGQQAEVTIMEFGDFECPHCAEIYPNLLKILVEYKGKVKLIWKDFPIPSHPQARLAALAARCAAEQGKFWEYHDYLFENQESLSRELYNQIALELNLNLAEFNKCLEGQDKIELVGQGLTDGQKLGVDATPYLFVGNQVFNYALSYEELKGVVDEELGK